MIAISSRLLLALGLATAVASASAPAQGGQIEIRKPIATSCAGCDSVERQAARRRALDVEVAVLTMQLEQHRFHHEHLQARLANPSTDPPTSPQERRELQARLNTTRGAVARTEVDLAKLCGEARPLRGYLGVMLAHQGAPTGAPASVSAAPFPVVWVVEPGSPAARAGVHPRDTVVAIDGADARNRSLDALLNDPGRKVTLSLKAGGPPRDVPITVDKRPASFGNACLNVSFNAIRTGTAMTSRRLDSAVGQAGAAARGGRVEVSVRASGERIGAQTDVPDSLTQTVDFFVIRSASGGTVMTNRSGPSEVIAGATVFMLNDGLKQSFDVRVDGALVLQVFPRTPSASAGLTSGDVIVRVGAQAVKTVAVLREAVQRAPDRSVKLEIVRRQESKTIILRW